MAIDRYDNVKKTDSGVKGDVAKEHAENDRLRGDVAKHDQKTALKGAFENYQKGNDKIPSPKSPSPLVEEGTRRMGEGNVPKNVVKSSPSNFFSSEGSRIKKGNVPDIKSSPSEGGNVPKNVNPNVTQVNSAASTFAQNVKVPDLQAILKAIPLQKPVVVEPKKREGQEENPIAKQVAPHIDSSTQVAPMANPNGTKMAANTTSGGKEKNEATKDKDQPKTKEGTKTASGKGGTQHAARSAQNGSFEAASSGVASEGQAEEPAPLIVGFNAASEGDENCLSGKEGHMLCEKNIVKPKTFNNYWASLEGELDNENDPRAEEILKLNRAFPDDVNGGKRG